MSMYSLVLVSKHVVKLCNSYIRGWSNVMFSFGVYC